MQNNLWRGPVRVQQNYGFIRVEGPSSAEKDVVVLSFVNELVGRDVRVTYKDEMNQSSLVSSQFFKNLREYQEILCRSTESLEDIQCPGLWSVKPSGELGTSFFYSVVTPPDFHD